MILIIAEKPSLARNIAAAVGNVKKYNGYLECGEYLVAWAFGHLFSLCDIEDYTGEESAKGWSMKGLPCFPEDFRFRLRRSKDSRADAGVARQFDIIKSLCAREDVTQIVNAGDADREGEIIVRLCVQNALAAAKPFKRLWLPDQTEQTVRKALSEMKDESEYDLLANEGFARMYIDWLYGVNLTRYATLRTGTLLRVGRVIVPVVKAIYDRDTAIKNFTPEKYLAISGLIDGEKDSPELTSKFRFSAAEKEKALEKCAELNAADSVVTAKKTKNDVLSPGKLYSLSKLQNVLGKKYKMSMDDSLKTVQKLYEDGYLTYPRTNSEYLATAEKDKIKKIVDIVSEMGYPLKFTDKKTIFDDSKIESHSALTPTYKIPDPKKLSDDESKVYSTVFRRFAAVFCAQECKVQKTEITIDVGGIEQFTVKGLCVLEKGWMKYDDSTQKDRLLPSVNKGDKLNITFSPKEKETSPPKHYTIETLNNYLKNPFREEKAAASSEDDDAAEYAAMFEGLELGTEATRTGIIGNAVNSKYIELKKDVYRILPDGEYLINSLSQLNISMDKYKTSTLGQALKKVYHGQMSIRESVKLAEDEISEVFSFSDGTRDNAAFTGFYGDETGVCPLCGAMVVKGKYAYGCKNYKEGCRFRINFNICGAVISAENAKKLLRDGKTDKISGFVSKKTGKPFEAYLALENGKVVFMFDN